MKKTRSTNLRRAWPSSDFSERALERTRSRSEKDYRLHKHYPPFISQSPRGFVTAGDVSPLGMSPISQSQFIPLGEILCLAISAMNATRQPVTQEALMEHLSNYFPGVPTPSTDILRHTLKMLVRERKIYPTTDGYFTVAQQAYFITPSMIRTSSKWYHLDERVPDRSPQQCTSPQSGTITPSTSGCVRDRAHHKNHCDSFNSYREDPPSHHASTLQRKSPKDVMESYSPPSPHPQKDGKDSLPAPSPHQATATEKIKGGMNFPFKSDAAAKHKDGGGGGEKQSKKFGLKLFRLSFKKDKTKQVATFSAQFPPEEWPLRDEEVPSTIPRDVELEIIRRINPDLTVENVMRHTAVMKRREEERAQRSKASSGGQLGGRNRRSRGHRKAQAKYRSHSKTRAARGGPSDNANLDAHLEPHPVLFSMERYRGRYFVQSNPNIVESHLHVTPEWDVSGELAKRRTEMPFPEPSRGTSFSKVHRSHSHTQDRKSRDERSDKVKERSRSMDNSKGPLGAVSSAMLEDYNYDVSDRSRYYADSGTLRAFQAPHYSRTTLSAAKFSYEVCMPDPEMGKLEDSKVCGPLEKSKRDNLSVYGDLNPCLPQPTDDYFQCNVSRESVLIAPSPLGNGEHDPLALSEGVKKGCCSERPATHLASPHPIEYKEESVKGQLGVCLPIVSQAPEPNGRLMHPHNIDTGSTDKRKEIFSKDTLFKPPHNVPNASYTENGYSKSGSLRKGPNSSEMLNSHEHFDKTPQLSSSPGTVAQQGTELASGPDGTFDYYNVSDDDDSSEATRKLTEEGPGQEGGGTVQWLLDREKERELQHRFEKNLSLLSPKESDNMNNQQSTHSARLDSMDSSSVTVDSGFNSPRTRESLASNTSSIVESNRRQNPALSPGHLGTAGAPLLTFRTVLEPPATQPEKLQKSSNCLTSITSV